jgi:phosphotransferase system enzyme I (PtsP)
MQAATICNKPVSLCGEMAGDPVAVVLLLGLGIEILSMSANQIPKVKWVIRNFSKADAKDILTQVLAMDYTQDIRAYVEQALIKAGLGILVRSNQ